MITAFLACLLLTVSDKSETIDAWIRSEKNFPSGFSGCVLIADKGEVVLARGYGFADAERGVAMPTDAIWDWASVTKQFTAAAILKLEMQRKLKIDDPIHKYFKDAPKDKRKVTVRHLLNHTSGHGYHDAFQETDFMSRDATVRAILALPMAAEPGARFEYSNAAYFLLAALIELRAGMPYETYLRKYLFKPAGMTAAGCIGDPHIDMARVPLEDRGRGEAFAYGPRLSWGYRGAGGVLATVDEMLLWDRALAGEKVLSKQAKEKLFAPGKSDYALGWFVDTKPGVLRQHHSGSVGALVTWFERRPQRGRMIAIACNGEPPIHPELMAQELFGMLD